MVCDVCGNGHFTTTEYRAGACRAPALECDFCHAVNLREEAATTEEERASVKMAIAIRASATHSDV
jgi:hypothetical protein